MSDSETNGNVVGEHRGPNVATGSVEDLSEYTDADESISAPTEILAEFLSAIMLKDYETALKYCKLILHYEPNNSTAREFYPLIMEKIELMKAQQDETDDDSSSDFSGSVSSISSNNAGEESEKSTDSDATSASYSSLEDEEADRENNVREPGNTSFTSNDIANGNTARSNESTNAAGGISNSRKDKTNGNEELKRKLENVIRRNSISLTENIKSSPTLQRRDPTNNNNLTLTPNLRRSTRFQGDAVFDDAKNRSRSTFSIYKTKSCSNSPKHEADQVDNAKHPIFSSDSESPTDPTIQEIEAILRKSKAIENRV